MYPTPTYEITLRPEFRVKACVDKDGMLQVELVIPTMHGDFKLTGCYPLHKAARAVVAWFQKRGVRIQKTDTSGFFSKIKNLAKKVAAAKALAPLLKSAAQITKNPVLARAVGLATVVVPGLGSAKIAAEKATSLVQSAIKKAPKALADLRKLKSLAAMGSPQGVQAWNLAQAAFKAVQSKQPMDFLRGAPSILAHSIPGYSFVSGETPEWAVSGAVAPLVAALQPSSPPYSHGAWYGC